MKYIEYISIILFTAFNKVFGLIWIYMALPLRKYARNTVYNYVLANGVYLQRLLERDIIGNDTIYVIQPYHKSNGGYITKRKVSWIEYKLVYWLIWGWLDDDSNEDTYSWGHMERHYSEYWKSLNLAKPYYGNSFDLGDKRAEYPSFHLIATTIWTWRNTASNFCYAQYTKSSNDKDLWNIKLPLFGWELGWYEVEDKDYYNLVFLGWK